MRDLLVREGGSREEKGKMSILVLEIERRITVLKGLCFLSCRCALFAHPVVSIEVSRLRNVHVGFDNLCCPIEQ